MNPEKLQARFLKLKMLLFYHGDIELARYFLFELDRVLQDLLAIDYEVRFCQNTVDNSTQYWKNRLK